MFKSVFSILLFLSFALQTFKGSVVVLEYYTNTNAFSKNCINKAKPALHCNGKCQMLKKIQAQESKDQQVPERRIENKLELISSNAFLIGLHEHFFQLVESPIAEYRALLIKGANKDFFHPPQY